MLVDGQQQWRWGVSIQQRAAVQEISQWNLIRELKSCSNPQNHFDFSQSLQLPFHGEPMGADLEH